jgi:hypothetical protein
MILRHPIARLLFGRTFDQFDLIALIVQFAVIGFAAWLGAVLAHPRYDWIP